MRYLKKLLRIVFGRTGWVVIFLLIQIGFLMGCFLFLTEYIPYVYVVSTVVTVIVIIYILNKKEETSYKLAWIVPILAFPIFGTLFYIYMELQVEVRLIARRLRQLLDETDVYLK